MCTPSVRAHVHAMWYVLCTRKLDLPRGVWVRVWELWGPTCTAHENCGRVCVGGGWAVRTHALVSVVACSVRCSAKPKAPAFTPWRPSLLGGVMVA